MLGGPLGGSFFIPWVGLEGSDPDDAGWGVGSVYVITVQGLGWTCLGLDDAVHDYSIPTFG